MADARHTSSRQACGPQFRLLIEWCFHDTDRRTLSEDYGDEKLKSTHFSWNGWDYWLVVTAFHSRFFLDHSRSAVPVRIGTRACCRSQSPPEPVMISLSITIFETPNWNSELFKESRSSQTSADSAYLKSGDEKLASRRKQSSISSVFSWPPFCKFIGWHNHTASTDHQAIGRRFKQIAMFSLLRTQRRSLAVENCAKIDSRNHFVAALQTFAHVNKDCSFVLAMYSAILVISQLKQEASWTKQLLHQHLKSFLICLASVWSR